MMLSIVVVLIYNLANLHLLHIKIHTVEGSLLCLTPSAKIHIYIISSSCIALLEEHHNSLSSALNWRELSLLSPFSHHKIPLRNNNCKIMRMTTLEGFVNRQESKCSTQGGGVNARKKCKHASLTELCFPYHVCTCQPCVFEWEMVMRIDTIQQIKNRHALNQSQNKDLTNQTGERIPCQ